MSETQRLQHQRFSEGQEILEKFSKVSLLLYLLLQMAMDVTFENVYSKVSECGWRCLV